MTALPLPLAGRLPHRPPMLWLDELVELDASQGVAVGRIGEDNPLRLEDGRLDPLAAVELVAQAAAALAEGEGGPAEGEGRSLLVGLREFVFEACAVRSGDVVCVRVRRGKRWEELAVYHGTVELDGRPLAAGGIKVHTARAAQSPAPTQGIPLPPRAARSIHPLPGRWGQATAEGVVYRLDGSFPAFHGHFPGAPILPAVVACALAVQPALVAVSGARLRRIVLAKFTRPVVPGERLDVTCRRTADASESPYQAVVRVGEEQAAALSFELAVDAGRAGGRPCA